MYPNVGHTISRHKFTVKESAKAVNNKCMKGSQ